MGITAAGMLVATGFSVAPVVFYGLLGLPLAFLIAAPAVRRLGYRRLAGVLETSGLMYGQGSVALLLIIPLAAVSLPFADWWLVSADRMLGFDWVAFAHLSRPVLSFLKFAYTSFVWQPLLLLIALFRTGRDDRAWRMVSAASLTLLITIVIFPLAPAEGPFVHFHMTKDDLPGLQMGWRYPHILHLLKDQGVRRFDQSIVEGLVSIPSYHAAGALLLTWGSWPLRRARWFFLVLNSLLVTACLAVGAHYLIDLVAGIAVGAVALSIITFAWPRLFPTLGTAPAS